MRVPIRMKLAGALVVPLVALVVVTVLEVLDTYSDVDEVHDQAELATSTIGTPSLLSKLEDERNAAAIFLLDLQDAFALPVEDNAEAWGATDRALDEFRADVERRGGGLADTYAPALDALGGLDDVRASVEGFEGQRGLDNMDEVARAFDDYTEIMDTLFAANQQVIVSIHDTELRQGAELADLSARQTDILARLVRDLMVTTLSGDRDGVNQQVEVAAIGRELGLLRNNEALIRTKAEGAYRPLAESLFGDDDVQRFPELVRGAIETGTFDLLDVAEASAGDDADSFGYTAFRDAATDELERQADAAQADADQRLARYIALAALATVAALIATWLVSRSITRPLRSLTGQAKEMAEERLPSVVLDILETPLGDDVQVPETVPVAVRTRDEVADVAAALNTVQDTAVDLAAEQAVLRRNIADSFVNLGRRNQNLLGRQLDFITELESNETHPDTLASLFRLDHLATRMRRNAESLLVLAGIEPPRKWASPLRINDVIRSALGEVEDYQRVVIRGVEPATIVGSAAADLAHLIAELVENALVFSPSEQTVEIRGASAGPGLDGSPGGYRLAVIDSGYGMGEDDLALANLRLAGAESFTIAPSKYLGHYVAGNLAERHGIHIHLDTSPGGGVTASVDLPAALLTAEAATEPLGGSGIRVAAGGPRHRAPEPAFATFATVAATPAARPHTPDASLPTAAFPPFDTTPADPIGPPDTPGFSAFDTGPTGPTGPAHGPGITAFDAGPTGLTGPAENPGITAFDTGATGPTRLPANPGLAAFDTDPTAPAAPGQGTGFTAFDNRPTGPDGPGDATGFTAFDDGANVPNGPGETSGVTAFDGGPTGPVGPPEAPEAPGAWDDVYGSARTAGGLAKRTPRGPGGAHGPGPTLPSDDLLASLRRHAGNLQGIRPLVRPRPPVTVTPPESRIEPFHPTPEPPPPPRLPTVGTPETTETTETPETTASGLARRVRGAQLPTADPRPIHRGGEAASESAPETASADDVYGFLSSFTAGVQRGLDQADNEDGSPP